MTSRAAAKPGGAKRTGRGAAKNTASAPASPAPVSPPKATPSHRKSSKGYICGWCIANNHAKCYNGFDRPGTEVKGWCRCDTCDNPAPGMVDDLEEFINEQDDDFQEALATQEAESARALLEDDDDEDEEEFF